MDGLLAALLAAKGFRASTSILEAKHGFLQVLSTETDDALLTADLGETWTLADNGFKPYACGSLTHPTIEGVIALREEFGFDAKEIVSIEAGVNDYVSWVTAKQEPQTGLEAKFSIFHCAAVAAVDGAASVRQFQDDRVNDPAVGQIRKRVSIAVDASLPKDAAVIAITLTDGRRLTREVMHNKGTPAKPMTDDEIEAKFLDLASPVIGTEAARDVATTCWRVEELDDFARIATLCRGRS
ncbi:MAG: hypothetical protein GEU78_17045 [Actinobacteria bacterium]|nr:hypothetical protein [Actinomycetota bacterium]